VPGIKVDKGLVGLALSEGDQTTQGLDGLGERLQEYWTLGGRFTKWRAVYHIGDSNPGAAAYRANAEGLARYAAISQSEGFVPIVEPEVLMDGSHSLDRCAEVTKLALNSVFEALAAHNVALAHMVLKPNMVMSGQDAPDRAGVDEVAARTAEILKECVPTEVPGIFFLSGGQGDVEATEHLNLMNKDHGPLPWRLSFSYGRALQAPALKAWGGGEEGVPGGQAALAKRARLNGAASDGMYSSGMEEEAAAV
jgi:fructose-bisphosphate aldolase class I